jgi:hypothetical protein
MIPAAAIKQSAPPTAAPITTLRFVLVESLLVLELRFTELAWLDKVLVRAVQSSIQGQDASSISVSGNITESALVNLLTKIINFESAPVLQVPLVQLYLY